jgi:hypothetical protein
MAFLLFANNATTTLAGGIASNATSFNVAAGTGALFPSPATGDSDHRRHCRDGFDGGPSHGGGLDTKPAYSDG